jgi:hypothetical protein
MNWGLSKKLLEAFPNFIPLDPKSLINGSAAAFSSLYAANAKTAEPLVNVSNYEPLQTFWVTDFIVGEGSFYTNKTSLKGFISPYFAIHLYSKDTILFERIQLFFNNVGAVYLRPTSTHYKVFRFEHILSIIYHLEANPLRGFKANQYFIWKEIVCLVKAKTHLTDSGLQLIQILREKLNQIGKIRAGLIST